MVLVPVQCPSCGANVDLEEGQTVVRCEFCKTTSKLVPPVAAPAPAAATPVPVPVRSPSKFAAEAPPAKAEGKVGLIVVLVSLIVGGVIAATKLTAWATFDHFEDGLRAQKLLAEKIEGKPRYLRVRLTQEEVLVELQKAKGKAVRRVLRGRELGKEHKAKVGRIEERGFGLWDAKFALVHGMVKDARRRSKGKLESLTLARKLDRKGILVWTARMKGGKVFLYDEHSVPLPESHHDYMYTSLANLAELKKAVGRDAKLIAMYINPGHLTLEVMAKGSLRDTDRYSFRTNGKFNGPKPGRSDGDAKTLAAQTFSFADLDFTRAMALTTQTEKLLDGHRSHVRVDRINGKLRYSITVTTKRGANRTATYDKDGKLVSRTK